MAKVSNVSVSDVGHKILIYGPPKTGGKTHAAGLVAEHFPGRTIWFDFEAGFKTLKRLPSHIQEGINLIQVPDTRSNQLAIRALDAMTKGGILHICDVHGRVGAQCIDCRKYTTKGEVQHLDMGDLTKDDLVVLDSATQLSNSAMALAMKDITDIETKPEWDHYFRQGLLLDRGFTMMQQSKANWIVISHDIDIEKSEKKTKLVPQAGTRNFSRTFAKYFDHVVYMNIQNGQFRKVSSNLAQANLLAGSRTGIDLQADVTLGLIELMRSVKASSGESVAKEILTKAVAPMAEPEEEEAVDPTAGMTLQEKLAFNRAKRSK